MAVDGVPDDASKRPPRVLVVGAGFAGFHCLQTLESLLPPGAAELVAVNPTDYMLYVPLLPEVAAAILEPRRVTVPLRARLPRTQVALGNITAIDLASRTCTLVDVERRPRTLVWDRLVLACGSVTRLLSVPGVTDHAIGFKSIAEAVYLRDHVLRQLELAELAEDPAERSARTTFVVVGAGYTGTEVAAQGQLLTAEGLRHFPRLSSGGVRWVLLDLAPRVLPGLNPSLSAPGDAGAPPPGRGGAARDHGQRSHRHLRRAQRRYADPDQNGRVVRGRASRSAGGGRGSADPGGSRGRRRASRGARPPRCLRRGRRSRRAGPRPTGRDHRHDRPARPAAGPTGRVQHRGVARVRGARPLPTSPTRSTCLSPARSPKPSPAATT